MSQSSLGSDALAVWLRSLSHRDAVDWFLRCIEMARGTEAYVPSPRLWVITPKGDAVCTLGDILAIVDVVVASL